jgi:hypothetical protein
MRGVANFSNVKTVRSPYCLDHIFDVQIKYGYKSRDV